MPYAQLSGRRIHFIEQGPTTSGRRSPILFLHGAGGSHQVWLEQLRRLGHRRTAIAIDLPGHGRSEGSGADRIEAYRDIVKEFLTALDLRRPVMVGHSMGGAIAMSLALVDPGLLAAMVLVGTGARLRVEPQLFADLHDDVRGAVERIAKRARAPGAPAEQLAQDVEAMLRTPACVLEADLRACDAFDLMERIKTITLPTLIICGIDDLMTPPKYAEYLHRQITGSQRALIPAAGHMVMLEQPDTVSREIEVFCERLV